MLALPTEWERCADVRMGDQDVVEALSGSGRFEDGAVEAVRGKPSDDPLLDQEPVNWTGICRPVREGMRRVRRWPTSWTRTRGSSTGALRSSRSSRRSVCSMRSAPRATRAATRVCGTTCARCGRASRSRLRSGFETPAGRQGQVDFGTFTLPWGRRHALVVVLGYSRLLWLRFYPRQTMAVLTEALESAFDRFGGVPEELLFDQMRAVVLSDDRAAGGGLVLNAEFLRFAAHWGFMPRSCRPYRAQTKGKVERPIRYIRESFFYGRTFANDDDLNEQAARWLEGTANLRRHAHDGGAPRRPLRARRAVGASPPGQLPLSAPRAQPGSRTEAAAPAGNCGGRAATAQGLCGGTAMKAPAPARRDRLRGDAGGPQDARRAGSRRRHPLGGPTAARSRRPRPSSSCSTPRSCCATTVASRPPCAPRGCRR